MTSDRFENTMHEWLADRAAGSAPARLHADAMTVIGTRRQRVGWWATLRVGITGAPTIPGRQAGMALRPLAALVLTLILGVALGFAVASRPAVLPVSTESPEPSPTSSALPTSQQTPWALSPPVLTTHFIAPFTYQLPIDTAHGFHLSMDGGDLQAFGFETGRVPGRLNYENWQFESPRGVAVFALGTPETQPCSTQAGVANTPSKFLELIGTVVGTDPGIGPITPTTIDGRPALTTSFRTPNSTCSGFIYYDQGRFPSRFLRPTIPSKFIAFEVGDQTIVIDISAQDDAEFDAWLPFATQFINSIHFVETPAGPTLSASPATQLVDKFVRNFTFQVPPGVSAPWTVTGDRLFSFTETSSVNAATHGMTVAVVDQAVVHECGGSGGRVGIRKSPAQLLDDIATIGGVDFADPTTTSLDGHPALRTSRSEGSAACEFADLHLTGSDLGSLYVGLTDPAQSIVADVDGLIVFVDLWATTDAELAAWLPTGMEIVDSIHFVEQ